MNLVFSSSKAVRGETFIPDRFVYCIPISIASLARRAKLLGWGFVSATVLSGLFEDLEIGTRCVVRYLLSMSSMSRVMGISGAQPGGINLSIQSVTYNFLRTLTAE